MIFIQIAGHLGQDPEVRFTPSGQKVTTIRVATNIKRGSKEKTVWWRVTLWGERFDKKLAYLKKGSAVIVWGEMGIPDIYQDKEGNPQTSFEIIAEHITFSPFGGGKNDRSAEGQEGEEGGYSPRQSSRATAGSLSAPVSSIGADDDVPF
jgi:single-strand DNA-binding protein